MEQTEKNPVHYRMRGGVEVTLWKNKGKNGKKGIDMIVINRSYKDKEGKWKKTPAIPSSYAAGLATLLQSIYRENETRND